MFGKSIWTRFRKSPDPPQDVAEDNHSEIKTSTRAFGREVAHYFCKVEKTEHYRQGQLDVERITTV